MNGKAVEHHDSEFHAPAIVPAAAGDLDTLVATLSSAFRYDPVMNWIFPDARIYPALFRLILAGSSLPHGMVHFETSGRGAALWLPPDTPFELPLGWPMLSLFAHSLWRMGPATLLRLRRQAELFAGHRPATPHFHLQFIGCRQGDQGRGVGAQLMKAGVRACDALGLPAYLECSNPRNLPLYQRHGFDTRGEGRLPGGGPQVWFMWREARPEGA